jgi:hypothetical protein
MPDVTSASAEFNVGFNVSLHGFMKRLTPAGLPVVMTFTSPHAPAPLTIKKDIATLGSELRTGDSDDLSVHFHIVSKAVPVFISVVESLFEQRGLSHYLTQPLRQFCVNHNIATQLADAITSVEASFPSRIGLDIRVDGDPEETGEWLVIEVISRDDVDTFLNSYNRCIAAWTDELPSAALMRIRLSYSFA